MVRPVLLNVLPSKLIGSVANRNVNVAGDVPSSARVQRIALFVVVSPAETPVKVTDAWLVNGVIAPVTASIVKVRMCFEYMSVMVNSQRG